MPDLSTSDAKRRRSAAVALAPGLIAFSMGQTALFAVAGPVIRDIGLSEIQLGMIVSAAAVMFVLASPIWGFLSDRLGRKPVIVFGLFTYAIISFTAAFSESYQLSPIVSILPGTLCKTSGELAAGL